MTPSIPLALWAAIAGHLLVLIAAVADAVPPNTAIVAAIACSIVTVAASLELAAPEVRVPRPVTALIAGSGVAATVMLVGFAPSVPGAVPLIGIAVAAALGLAYLAAAGRASAGSHQPRPLIMAPRVAAVALVVQALLRRWVDAGMSMSLRAVVFLSIAALGIAVLSSLAIIALRVRSRWALAGLLAWTVSWVTSTADLSSLIVGVLGGPLPTGQHQVRQLDAELVQILATAGGLAIGGVLAASIREVRFRHSAVVLLAGYAAFGVIAALAEHRLELAADFPSIAALRRNRELADAIAAFALAGVLWLYWRRVAAPHRHRATSRWEDD